MERIVVAPEDRVFVLTGAGISAESGLPTFRAEDGLGQDIGLKMCARPMRGSAIRQVFGRFIRRGVSRLGRRSRIRRILLWQSSKRS